MKQIVVTHRYAGVHYSFLYSIAGSIQIHLPAPMRSVNETVQIINNGLQLFAQFERHLPIGKHGNHRVERMSSDTVVVQIDGKA
jgi:hypothetical protein